MAGETKVESDLEFRLLENDADIEELILQIKDILQEGNSHNLTTFDRQHWEWQYRNLPTAETRIYVCICEKKIVGYYHVPIYDGYFGNVAKRFAMVQDVAISNKMRGRGVFRKLAEFATKDLVDSAAVNLIYTFPNQKSIHTFLKYSGYKEIYTYDTFVLPVSASKIIETKFSFIGIEKLAGFFVDKFFNLRSAKLPKDYEIRVDDSFDTETLRLFADFGKPFSYRLNRSKEYLKWRFCEKPKSKHFIITLRKGSEVVAVAVVKLDEILGTKTAVLIDFAFQNELDFSILVHSIRKDCNSLLGEQIGMIYTNFCCGNLLKTQSFGFIKVPIKLNPRPLKLLVKNVSESEDTVLNHNEWLALLSDWDVL
jgi:hypothetical protein